jgi:hypothetical protein
MRLREEGREEEGRGRNARRPKVGARGEPIRGRVKDDVDDEQEAEQSLG